MEIMEISQELYNFIYKSLEGTGIGRIPFIENIRRCWIRQFAEGKIIRTDYGAKLEIDKYDSTSLLRNNGVYESETRAFIEEALGEGGIAIDVGANIGYFTILMSRLSDKVYAFEPNGITRTILEGNVARNNAKNVTVDAHALSNSKGIMKLYGEQAWAGSNSLISDGRKPIASVETARLDSIIKEPKIRIMKMDIEGAELEALEGGIVTLKKTDYLAIEFNREILDKKKPKQEKGLIDFIKNAGFDILNLEKVKKEGGNLHCRKVVA